MSNRFFVLSYKTSSYERPTPHIAIKRIDEVSEKPAYQDYIDLGLNFETVDKFIANRFLGDNEPKGWWWYSLQCFEVNDGNISFIDEVVGGRSELCYWGYIDHISVPAMKELKEKLRTKQVA